MGDYKDYYSIFINNDIVVGYRNKSLFLASLNAFQSNRDIEPLISKAYNLGLKKSEIMSTVNSARKIANQVKTIFCSIDNGQIFDKDGNIINSELLFEHYNYQLKQMFCYGEQIVLGMIDDLDKSFKYKFISYEELINKDVPDGYNLIKINPMNNGLSDVNVLSYRHCLLECDNMPIIEQYNIIKDSKLPIKLVVYSGGKSLHVICNVNALNLNQYKERVEEIYNYAKSIGFIPDDSCKQPSRFTRLAGTLRGGIPQIVVLKNNNITYHEFSKTGYSIPSVCNLNDLLELKNTNNKVNTAIDGLLKKQQCMMLFGDSKIGKTFLLIQLACAFSYGGTWLSFSTTKGNVLYVNMEVDEITMAERFNDVINNYDCIKDNIFVINYRGFTTDIMNLINYLEDEIKTLPNIDYIILDPVYKITGDDNSTNDVKILFKYIDKLLMRGYTVIFCHHTHKNYFRQNITEQYAGSSIYGRAVDTLVSVYPSYKHMGKIWINFKSRSYPDINKMLVKFDYPIHIVCDNNQDNTNDLFKDGML